MNAKEKAGSAQVGTVAPPFRLQNQDEQWVTLEELVSRGPVMLAFYPGDFTPVCTSQLCGYQEAFDRLVQYGVRIIGISPNDPESHQRFRSRYRFAFDLLSDPGKKTFKAYGVTSLLLFGGISRAVFVLGKGGTVLYRYVEPTIITHRKSGELLEALDQLKAQGKL